MITPRASWLLVLALVTPAAADRHAEDWVGTWRGKATWTGCSVEGAATVAVPVVWRDAGLWLDASGLYEGLGELGPDARDGELAVDAKDLQVSLKRTKAGASLRLHTAAQCTLTAKLTRDGATGIAACDDVVALAAVASSCGEALEDEPADEIEAWRALEGKKAKRAGKACAARAAALREALIARECLAPEDDPSAEPACGETWALSRQLFACQRLPAASQQSLNQGVADLRRSLRTLHTDDAHETARAKCAETTEILRDIGTAYGCL